MEKDKLRIYKRVVNIIGQLLSLVKLYNLDHPVVKTKIKEGLQEFQDLILNKENLILSAVTGLLYVNGLEMPPAVGLAGRVAEYMNSLKIGSLELEPGLSFEEFSCLIELLSNIKSFKNETQVKQYLNQKGVKHLILRFATYKLVEDGEEIVKEGDVIKVDELPAGIVDAFLEGLKKGGIDKNILDKGKIHSVLLDNPQLFVESIFNLTKDKDSYDELVKIIWLIGDYLLNEISTAKEEEVSRNILNGLKERLISLYRQKQGKEDWKEEIHKTFTAINTTLEIKGFILLYRRHKKGVEVAAKRISKILKLLPLDSQLFRKTKEDLGRIGIPDLDTELFKSQSR